MTEGTATVQGVNIKQVEEWFGTTRTLTGSQQARNNKILYAGRQLAVAILEQTQPGPDQTAAIRQVREACGTGYQALLMGGGEGTGTGG